MNVIGNKSAVTIGSNSLPTLAYTSNAVTPTNGGQPNVISGHATGQCAGL